MQNQSEKEGFYHKLSKIENQVSYTFCQGYSVEA